MKKLTAGILASLIGLVSANSADAAVASKAYVDGAIETLDATYVGATAKADDGNYGFVAGVKEVDGKIETTGGQLALKENDAETGYTNNLTIEKEVAGDGTVTYKIGAAAGATYKGVDDVNISESGDINTKYFGAENVDITTATQETTAGDGWYVLMRKKTGEDDNGKAVYSYQWENLDRSYDANSISVEHDAEGEQTAQQ